MNRDELNCEIAKDFNTTFTTMIYCYCFLWLIMKLVVVAWFPPTLMFLY